MLPDVQDPVVLFEGEHIDSDGEITYVFTMGGKINGIDIARADHEARTVHGALLGGDAMMIHAANLWEAKEIATGALETTLLATFELMRQGELAPGPNAGIMTAKGGSMLS